MPVLPIVLIVVALLLAAPFLTWVAFSLKQTAFIVGLAALPFLILLGNRPNLWMILVAWIFGSNIRVVLGGTLTLFTVLSAGLAIILLARTIISKRTNPYGKTARRWGIGLLLVVIMTMYIRGIGFHFLGNGTELPALGRARLLGRILGDVSSWRRFSGVSPNVRCPRTVEGTR